jgi:capsular exopolysaccharide synthesis family protein
MNASNVAATFTRYGHKTVLVDCDFRRPVQQRFNRIAHDEGLLAWASRGFPLSEDLIKPGGPVGLTILPDGTSLIPAGGVDVQPGHVLVARQVGELFRRLAEAYDVVIIDSPPAGVFQDALLLARYCAESIVFVREGRAFSSQLKKVLADLEKTTAPAVGLVLNGASLSSVHPSVGSRYGYGKYGYGKDYSSNYSYKAPTSPTNWRAPKPAPRIAAGATGKK